MDRGGSVLSIRTEASARLARNGAGEGIEGDVRRSIDWSFDAAKGRLLSLDLEQTTHGAARGPRGEMKFSQVTRIALTPAG